MVMNRQFIIIVFIIIIIIIIIIIHCQVTSTCN